MLFAKRIEITRSRDVLNYSKCYFLKYFLIYILRQITPKPDKKNYIKSLCVKMS